eukprot:CAMPEP_0197936500 /NCGR_PEP_ID=MMETSP1439-20131203/115020_1 /TAXON_ID=66791 /ORGANISM="Gonyaulax spinifera, Strain CCMP409" /LENGTH=51 /DNA_ID=CAMNT_0043559475 /DNA_START=98 /DNA_END=250 /DNA_ORIENTATION=-
MRPENKKKVRPADSAPGAKPGNEVAPWRTTTPRRPEPLAGADVQAHRPDDY